MAKGELIYFHGWQLFHNGFSTFLKSGRASLAGEISFRVDPSSECVLLKNNNDKKQKQKKTVTKVAALGEKKNCRRFNNHTIMVIREF